MDAQTYEQAAKFAEADGNYAVAMQIRAAAQGYGLGGLAGKCGLFADFADHDDELRITVATNMYRYKYGVDLPPRVRDQVLAEQACSQASVQAVVDRMPPQSGTAEVQPYVPTRAGCPGGVEWSTNLSSDANDLFYALEDYYCRVNKRPLPQRVYDAALAQYTQSYGLCTWQSLADYAGANPPQPGDTSAMYANVFGTSVAACAATATPGNPDGTAPDGTTSGASNPNGTPPPATGLPTAKDVMPIAIGGGLAALLLFVMSKRKHSAG